MSEMAVRELWDKRRGEGAAAFAAFAIYRDLGPERALWKVADAVKKSPSHIEAWSSTHNWGERVDAFDLHRDRERQREDVEQERRMRQRHVALGAQLSTMALLRARGAQAEGQRGAIQALDANSLSASEVSRLAEAGVRIERLSRGLATDLTTAANIKPDQWLSVARDLIEAALNEIEAPEPSTKHFLARVEEISQAIRV